MIFDPLIQKPKVLKDLMANFDDKVHKSNTVTLHIQRTHSPNSHG